VVRWFSIGAMTGFGGAIWLDHVVDLQQLYTVPILAALCFAAMIPALRERSA
jgi:hypothetical protein